MSILKIVTTMAGARLLLSDPEKSLVASTNTGVSDFLNAQGVKATDLARFVSYRTTLEGYKSVDPEITKMLSELDHNFGPVFCKAVRIPLIPVFTSYYSYVGKLEALSAWKMYQALRAFLAENPVDEVQIYDSGSSGILDTPLCTSRILSAFLRHNGVHVGVLSASNSDRSALSLRVRLRGRARQIRDFVRDKFQEFRLSKELVVGLSLDSAYAIDFLRPDPRIKGGRILIADLHDQSFTKTATKFVDFEELKKLHQAVKAFSKFEKPEYSLASVVATQVICDHFLSSLNSVAMALAKARELRARHNPQFVTLGASPAGSIQNAVAIEYFRHENIPIVGAQHGGSYGIQNCLGTHFDGDFDRCDWYFTFGFTDRDLLSTYPERKSRAKMVPVGLPSVKLPVERTPQRRLKVDVLYPFSIVLPLSENTLQDTYSLTQIQKKIIAHLDHLTDLRSIAKPPMVTNERSCMIETTLLGLRHVEILRGVRLRQVFENYEVGLVVLEYPSTPLYEVIAEDVEIIQLVDATLPFESSALALLKKRVHVCDTVDEVLAKIDQFRAGALTKLRNQEFLKRHVYQPDSQTRIRAFLGSLVESPTKPLP